MLAWDLAAAPDAAAITTVPEITRTAAVIGAAAESAQTVTANNVEKLRVAVNVMTSIQRLAFGVETVNNPKSNDANLAVEDRDASDNDHHDTCQGACIVPQSVEPAKNSPNSD